MLGCFYLTMSLMILFMSGMSVWSKLDWLPITYLLNLFIGFLTTSYLWLCYLNCTVWKKQPPKVFCKKKSVLKNLAIFTGKNLCWSLLLIRLQAFKRATLFKRDLNTGVICHSCEIFKNTDFEEHLLMTASVSDN